MHAIKLPRYIVEGAPSTGWKIWDTFKHVNLPGKYEEKQKAVDAVKELEKEK